MAGDTLACRDRRGPPAGRCPPQWRSPPLRSRDPGRRRARAGPPGGRASRAGCALRPPSGSRCRPPGGRHRLDRTGPAGQPRARRHVPAGAPGAPGASPGLAARGGRLELAGSASSAPAAPGRDPGGAPGGHRDRPAGLPRLRDERGPRSRSTSSSHPRLPEAAPGTPSRHLARAPRRSQRRAARPPPCRPSGPPG